MVANIALGCVRMVYCTQVSRLVKIVCAILYVKCIASVLSQVNHAVGWSELSNRQCSRCVTSARRVAKPLGAAASQLATWRAVRTVEDVGMKLIRYKKNVYYPLRTLR
jgi:hypothetical protein